MHVTKLRAVGGSVMFAIPKPILEGLGLKANTEVGVSIAEGRLIIDPIQRKRYSLSELLDQCDPAAPLSDEDRQWLNDPPRGQEVI